MMYMIILGVLITIRPTWLIRRLFAGQIWLLMILTGMPQSFFLEEGREYLSAGRIAPDPEHTPYVHHAYAPEYLISNTIPNYLEHRLNLTFGTPAIFLRNLNLPLGLCDGTRLLVTRLPVTFSGYYFNRHCSWPVCIHS